MKLRIDKKTSKEDLLIARDVLRTAMNKGFERKLLKLDIEGFDIEFEENPFNVSVYIYDVDKLSKGINGDLIMIEEFLFQKSEEYIPIMKIINNFNSNRKPTAEMTRKSDEFRYKIMSLANHINSNIYAVDERFKAMEHLELAQMYINKAIFNYDRRQDGTK
jgi:hypothetical protein